MLVFKKAETEHEVKEAYKLRFKVYCQEKKFEPEGECKSQREMDEYDAYSVHFIAKVHDDIVGTARLIRNNPIGFPVEKNCKLDIALDKESSGQTAEVSRFAISKQMIKSAGCSRSGIMIGLIREIYMESKILGIECFYAAMGKGLQKLLQNSGFTFYQNGPVVEYHGPRAPYFSLMKDIEEGISMNFSDSAISDEVPQLSYVPA